MIRRFLVVSLALCFALAPVFLPGQETGRGPVTGGSDLNAIDAAREFRVGIQAFNRFAFNEAILAFERSLSFRPGEAVILDWLGRAYYRSGLEGIAINQWRAAADAYGRSTEMGLIMASRVEIVSGARSFLPIADDNVRYIQSGRYPGSSGELTLFRQPSSLLPQPDGSVWVVAYGSNEVVRIGVNGTVMDRRRGPLEGFDRPYDMARGLDGRMYVSEYRGGRVSILSPQGQWLASIGSRGRGDGMLIGPKNMAFDESGYLYVVDYGNMRVSKFDPDGVFILSFGARQGGFPGFRSPTGIAATAGRIFVADSVQKSIYMFDGNGSYLGILTDRLTAPEGLSLTSDSMLIAADGNRVLLIDPDTAVIRELGASGNPGNRLVNADIDTNGNLLTVNFDESEVSLLTRFDDLASGLFVRIERVFAEQFPMVTVELSVEDRLRRPVVGLQGLNFVLSEGGRLVRNQEFRIPAYRVNRSEFSLLMERSPETRALQDSLAAAARDANGALGNTGRIRSVVSAGEQPFMERHENSLEAAARGSDSSYSAAWRFDLGLRLAATDLLAGEQKRSVVYIGSGNLGDLAFEQYSLAEMAAYLANNSIVFNAVIVGGGQPSQEVLYLASQTGGQAVSLLRPQGIGEIISRMADAPSGVYSISFNSQLDSDFGRAWLPVEAEVYLMERSGRDAGGYFAPLQ